MCLCPGTAIFTVFSSPFLLLSHQSTHHPNTTKKPSRPHTYTLDSFIWCVFAAKPSSWHPICQTGLRQWNGIIPSAADSQLSEHRIPFHFPKMAGTTSLFDTIIPHYRNCVNRFIPRGIFHRGNKSFQPGIAFFESWYQILSKNCFTYQAALSGFVKAPHLAGSEKAILSGSVSKILHFCIAEQKACAAFVNSSKQRSDGGRQFAVCPRNRHSALISTYNELVPLKNGAVKRVCHCEPGCIL